MRYVGWVVAAVVLAVVGTPFLKIKTAAHRWEQRAAAAESLAVVAAEQSAAARAEADSFARLAARQDTVVRWRVRRVAMVDSIHPPAADCLPNLGERDALIAAQQDQIETLQQETLARGRALTILQGSHDNLQRTLAARPRPSAFHGPSIGVGAFIGVCADGQPCVGVGLTLNLLGRKLL